MSLQKCWNDEIPADTATLGETLLEPDDPYRLAGQEAGHFFRFEDFISLYKSMTYCTGTVITLRAHPGVKSYFVGWGGDCPGTERTTQVTMDADKTCIAILDEASPSIPVDGVIVPVNKLKLLAPWLGLMALAVIVALAVTLVRGHRG